MTYKITSKKKPPAGVKLAKKSKAVKVSTNEVFPLTKMKVGDSFFANAYSARQLRGIIHKYPRNRGMKFVSKTVRTSWGDVEGAFVWRVK